MALRCDGLNLVKLTYKICQEDILVSLVLLVRSIIWMAMAVMTEYGKSVGGQYSKFLLTRLSVARAHKDHRLDDYSGHHSLSQSQMVAKRNTRFVHSLD